MVRIEVRIGYLGRGRAASGTGSGGRTGSQIGNAAPARLHPDPVHLSASVGPRPGLVSASDPRLSSLENRPGPEPDDPFPAPGPGDRWRTAPRADHALAGLPLADPPPPDPPGPAPGAQPDHLDPNPGRGRPKPGSARGLAAGTQGKSRRVGSGHDPDCGLRRILGIAIAC